MKRKHTITAATVIILIAATATAIRFSESKEKPEASTKENISSARAGERPSYAKAERSQSPKSVIPMTEGGKIDWVALFRNYDTWTGEERSKKVVELARLVAAMNDDELLAVMDEVAKLEITSYGMGRFANYAAEQLAMRQPGLVLDRLAGRGETHDMMSSRQIYTNLLEQDPAAAERWLDQKIADGFEFWVAPRNGELLERNILEGALVTSLREKDPMLAMERVMRRPEEQQGVLLLASNDHQYVTALNQALDYHENTGDVSILGSLFRDESMKYLALRGDPEEFEQTRQAFERISDENLRAEANKQLDIVSGQKVERVPLNLLKK